MSQYITTQGGSSSYTIRIPRELRESLDDLRLRAKSAGVNVDISRCASDALGKLVREANRALDGLEGAEEAKPAAAEIGDGEVEQEPMGYRP